MLNRVRAFFGRRRLSRQQELSALRAEVSQHRHASALYASLHGADLQPGANLDTRAWKMFVNLDSDYRALEKENSELRIKNMTLEKENHLLKFRLMGWGSL